MKKLRLLLLALAVLLLFSSCTAGETELKNRLIIEGIGVDWDEKEEQYALTIQVLVTAPSNGKENTAENPVANYTVRGKTIAEAINELCDTTGKNPLYSQNRIIVLGASLSDDKAIRALDYFAREYTARSDVYVAAASGKASDILQVAGSGGEITAKIIEQSILASNKNSISVNAELFNVINLHLEETTAFTMPLLEVDKDRNGQDKSVKVTGTYVHTNGDNENRLSTQETMFFLLMTDKAEKGTFSIEQDGTAAGLDIIKASAKTDVALQDGVPHYTIHVSCTADMIEFDTPQFGNFTAEDMKKIEAAAESTLKEGMETLLKRQLKEEKSDIFRFGRRLMQNEPVFYESVRDDWENYLPEIDCTVSVSVTIRRIGQETMIR